MPRNDTEGEKQSVNQRMRRIRAQIYDAVPDESIPAWSATWDNRDADYPIWTNNWPTNTWTSNSWNTNTWSGKR